MVLILLGLLYVFFTSAVFGIALSKALRIHCPSNDMGFFRTYQYCVSQRFAVAVTSFCVQKQSSPRLCPTTIRVTNSPLQFHRSTIFFYQQFFNGGPKRNSSFYHR